MPGENKAILEKANAASARGDIEGFLAFCADDVEWTTVGEATIRGKDAVREWMDTMYMGPPKFTVGVLIAEGDFVAAQGDVTMRDKDGKAARYSYCDIWRFRGDKMVELRAFLIKTEAERETGGAA